MQKSFCAIFLSVVSAMAADIYTFELLPADGNIAGPAGSTIGWGYTIENQSASLWLVTTGVNSGGFLFGTPLVIFDFPDLAPGASVSVPFDAALSTGLQQLTWDASAPAGFVNSGIFLLNAEWWDGGPMDIGSNPVSAAPSAERPYSATVTPEPATSAVVAFSLLAGAIGAKRRLDSIFRSRARS